MRHHQDFAACDDGELAEGYSDAVVNLFAHDWRHFKDFSDLARESPGFQAWALSHIDSSASPDDLRRVVENSSGCKGDSSLVKRCASIQEAAKRALNESPGSPSEK
jgi:hypothetical protein